MRYQAIVVTTSIAQERHSETALPLKCKSNTVSLEKLALRFLTSTERTTTLAPKLKTT
jgi:hypothetical protein